MKRTNDRDEDVWPIFKKRKRTKDAKKSTLNQEQLRMIMEKRKRALRLREIKTKERRFPFSRLPGDLWLLISDFLDIEDKLKLKRAFKTINRLICENRTFARLTGPWLIKRKFYFEICEAYSYDLPGMAYSYDRLHGFKIKMRVAAGNGNR